MELFSLPRWVIFGGLIGGIIAFVGALIGSILLFLIVRAGLQSNLIEKLKSSPVFPDLSLRIYRNQFRYLLFLRFFPMFPFWMVNLAPAILGIRFKIVFFTSFIGILPGTFVVASIGERMRIFSNLSTKHFYELILEPGFILPFVALSAIVILPTFLKVSQYKK